MSIYTMGIDVGSTASKCVILKDGSEIVAKSLVAVGTGTSGPSRAIAQVLENAGMTREQMDFVLATGYGRNSLDGLADMQMSELSCHAKGAAFLFPNVRTVVDIGGQDVKVIEIENGMMKNFVMNDKCAAGTGRFLDVMARVLEVKVEELGDLGDKSTKEVGISSTCTVFAESEVISQLAMGTNKCDIIHGIHKSVAGRVSGLCHRIGVRDDVVMTGGVAQNHGIVKALQEQLGHEIHTTPLTQYNGALGAALFAYQKAFIRYQIFLYRIRRNQSWLNKSVPACLLCARSSMTSMPTPVKRRSRVSWSVGPAPSSPVSLLRPLTST